MHLAERIADLEYDACVVTGDLRYRKYGTIAPALDGFRVVRERMHGPVYAVLGNHDPAEMLAPLAALDVRVLVNEATVLEHAGAHVHLVGVDDPHWFRADDLEAALDGVPEDECRILLAHAPEIYEEAEARGVDLMLCGHTHGGQIALPGGWPPFLNVRCPRRFAVRAWRHGRLRGYTTVGAGCSSIPLRLQVRPEVVIHRLRPDGSSR
jgi:predicted MPP superfamily phosphohydrolase